MLLWSVGANGQLEVVELVSGEKGIEAMKGDSFDSGTGNPKLTKLSSGSNYKGAITIILVSIGKQTPPCWTRPFQGICQDLPISRYYENWTAAEVNKKRISAHHKSG